MRKKGWWVILAALQAGALAAETPAPQQDKPQIRALLLEEAFKPKQAPPHGQTAWDLVEQAAYQTRKARAMLADAKGWSTGADRPAEEWTRVDQRINKLESIYRQTLGPGLQALTFSFDKTRRIVADADLVLQERESYAKIGFPTGPNSAFSGHPNSDSLEGLSGWREQSAGSAVQAQELLEKGLNRLDESKAKISQVSAPWYLEDLVQETEESWKKAAAKALDVAKAQETLLRKKGPYWNTINAIGAYGGRKGKGPFLETERAKAVQASNEAKLLFVINEYTFAGRIEEVRTMEYMLDRFGKP